MTTQPRVPEHDDIKGLYLELEQADLLAHRMNVRRQELALEASNAGASVREIAKHVTRVSPGTIYYWIKKARDGDTTDE